MVGDSVDITPTAPERTARKIPLSSILLSSKMTFVPGRNLKISDVASIPLVASSSTAMTTKSGASRRQISIASAPVPDWANT
jgi:hypothetical protein